MLAASNKPDTKTFFRYGADILRTRMYRSFRDLREGWTKNLALLFAHPTRLALARLQEFVVVLAGLLFSIWAAVDRHYDLAAVSAILTVALYGLLWRRIARAHFSWTSNILAFAGLPMFAYFLVRSKVLARRWQGKLEGTHLRRTLVVRSQKIRLYGIAPKSCDSFLRMEWFI